MPDAPQQPGQSLRRDARDALERCAGWNSRMAARRITRFIEARLAPAGLTSAQFAMLCLVAGAHDDTLGDLAEQADLDQSTLSRNLEGLVRAGWVTVALAEGDRRRRVACLTVAGAHRLEAAMPLWRHAQADLEQRLGAALQALRAASEALDTSSTG
jgi:DNA-binding MarR family transcriptional regulator